MFAGLYALTLGNESRPLVSKPPWLGVLVWVKTAGAVSSGTSGPPSTLASSDLGEALRVGWGLAVLWTETPVGAEKRRTCGANAMSRTVGAPDETSMRVGIGAKLDLGAGALGAEPNTGARFRTLGAFKANCSPSRLCVATWTGIERYPIAAAAAMHAVAIPNRPVGRTPRASASRARSAKVGL